MKPRLDLREQGQGTGPKAKAIKFGVKAPRGQGLDLRSQGQGTGPEAKAKVIKFGLEVPRCKAWIFKAKAKVPKPRP